MSSRASVSGLRDSDPLTLSILLQDVLRKPLVQVEPACLCDLLALAEVPELPAPIRRELSAWTSQMLREFRDLPDATGLADFVRELAAIDPALIPNTLRKALAERAISPTAPATARAVAALQERFAATPPAPVLVRKAAPARKVVEAAPAPNRHAAVAPPSGLTGRGDDHAPRGPRAAAAPRTPAAQVDPRREEWIREVVLERLLGRDVKESVLLAGLKHRTPFHDMEEEEMRRVLRKMEREGRLRQSEGRWSRRR